MSKSEQGKNSPSKLLERVNRKTDTHSAEVLEIATLKQFIHFEGTTGRLNLNSIVNFLC